MVILSYHQGDDLSGCSICVEFTPIELTFIGQAVEYYLRRDPDLTLERIIQLASLADDFYGAINEFKNQREAWRKERRS